MNDGTKSFYPVGFIFFIFYGYLEKYDCNMVPIEM